MATNIDILLRVLQASQARSEIERTGGSVKGLGDKVEETGRRFNKNGREIDEFGRFVKRAGDESAVAGGKFGKMGQLLGGLSVSAAGAGMMMLSQKFREAATEGDGVSQRLESILKQQSRLGDSKAIDEQVQRVTVEGSFADDDEIKNAAVLAASFSVETAHMGDVLELSARQARTMGMEVGGVATAMSKAYSTGNVAALRRTGVALSEQEAEAVKAAYGISQAAGQLKFMEVVGAAVRRTTVNLGDSLTDAQKAANDLARAGDDAMTALGRGANNAAATVGGIGTSALVAMNQFPGFLESAGYVGHLGGMAVTAGGSVLGIASQAGMATMGLQAMGNTGVGACLRLRAAAFAAAIGVGSITAALAVAVAGMAVLAGAAYVIYKYWKEMQTPTSSTKDVRDATAVAEDATAAKKSREIADAAESDSSLSSFDKLQVLKAARDKALQASDDALSEEITKRIDALKDTAGGRKAYKEGALRPSTAITSAARKYTDQLAGLTTHAAEATASNMPSASAAASPDDPQATINAMLEKSGVPKSAPVSAASMADMSDDDFTAVPASAPTVAAAASSPGSTAGTSPDAYTGQIRAIQDQIRDTKDKAKKKELQEQLVQLQRAKQDATKSDAAAKKAAADAARDAKTLAGADAAVQAELTRSRIDTMNDTRRRAREDAKDALDAELDKIRAAMKSKAMSQEAGQAKIDSLQEAFEKRQDGLDKASDAAIKRMEAESVLAEAAAKAAAETGAQKAATMQIANAKAASLRLDAAASERRAKEQQAKAAKVEAEANKPALSGTADFETKFRTLLTGRRNAPQLVAGSFGSDSVISPGARPIPRRLAAQEAGETARGDQKYIVELVVPNRYARDVEAV